MSLAQGGTTNGQCQKLLSESTHFLQDVSCPTGCHLPTCNTSGQFQRVTVRTNTYPRGRHFPRRAPEVMTPEESRVWRRRRHPETCSSWHRVRHVDPEGQRPTVKNLTCQMSSPKKDFHGPRENLQHSLTKILTNAVLCMLGGEEARDVDTGLCSVCWQKR